MKKTVIASVLGVVALVATVSSSYGQGTVVFQNYSFGADALNAPVTFASPGLDGTSAVTPGEDVGSTFVADLLYSLNGGSTYTLLTQANANQAAYPSVFGFSAADGDTGNYAGDFFGNGVTIPDYSSGAITFIVEAYNGSSYANSTGVGFWRGQSSAFTMPSIATGTQPVPDFVGYLTPFSVSTLAVPEPTTLALAGLGGLASLVAFRRKKA
ncbi:MAG TPA: PEP-CTERM sorting domain-containing protein [Verrucomicrobiae bacterium]